MGIGKLNFRQELNSTAYAYDALRISEEKMLLLYPQSGNAIVLLTTIIFYVLVLYLTKQEPGFSEHLLRMACLYYFIFSSKADSFQRQERRIGSPRSLTLLIP